MVSPKTPKISIIILNWNGRDDTLGCLESVCNIEYPNFDVIVVDNGSADNSVDTIRQHFVSVILIENKKNLGWAEGNNVGIRYVLEKGESEYILLLNNDTVVDVNLLKQLVATSMSYPDAGVLSPKILFYSKPTRISFGGKKWNQNNFDFELIDYGKSEDQKLQSSKTSETECGSGCALFFKTDVVKKIGFIEDRFFLGWEDEDWCMRAKKSGYKCLFVSDAKVWHKIAASFGKLRSHIRTYYFIRNRLLFVERNLSTIQLFSALKYTVRGILPPLYVDWKKPYPFPKKIYWAFSQFIRESIKRLKDPYYRSQVYGIRDYFLRRFGRGPAFL